MWLLALVLVLCACSQESTQNAQPARATTPTKAPLHGEVVIYTAWDREYSEPVLKKFEERTGIRVKAVYDTEAVKTVGLVNRLIAEKQRPVCDVFWNGEIVRTIELKRQGVTQPYLSPSAEGIPAELRDPEGHWTGFAARGRILCVNTTLLPDPAQYPSRVDELRDPKWKGRAGFGKPLFGSTATHAAVIWARDGEAAGLEFWKASMQNALMYSGNAQSRDAAADGETAWSLTDTDDAAGAIQDGKPVKIIYPDAGPHDVGVLLIPNTLTLIAGAPNPENGKALIDYLLTPEVEQAMAHTRAAQIPVRPGLQPPAGIPSLDGVHLMKVDWEKVADALTPCQTALHGLMQ